LRDALRFSAAREREHERSIGFAVARYEIISMALFPLRGKPFLVVENYDSSPQHVNRSMPFALAISSTPPRGSQLIDYFGIASAVARIFHIREQFRRNARWIDADRSLI